MDKVLVFPQIDYFGGCPKCARTDGLVNVGPVQWMVCHKHRTKWCIGYNVLSCWQYESDRQHRRNAAMLPGYREVESINGADQAARKNGGSAAPNTTLR